MTGHLPADPASEEPGRSAGREETMLTPRDREAVRDRGGSDGRRAAQRGAASHRWPFGVPEFNCSGDL
ncbi:MAG TPA: hypothetical protein VH916_10745 [Dehalococcoidia bacterium]|jgi:hypothetical protein